MADSYAGPTIDATPEARPVVYAEGESHPRCPATVVLHDATGRDAGVLVCELTEGHDGTHLEIRGDDKVALNIRWGVVAKKPEVAGMRVAGAPIQVLYEDPEIEAFKRRRKKKVEDAGL